MVMTVMESAFIYVRRLYMVCCAGSISVLLDEANNALSYFFHSEIDE